MAAEHAFPGPLELSALTSAASSRPCTLKAGNKLSYFQFLECVTSLVLLLLLPLASVSS